MAKILIRRGLKSRVYKRDSRGRFAETPDAPKPLKSRRKVARKDVEATRKGLEALPDKRPGRSQGTSEATQAPPRRPRATVSRSAVQSASKGLEALEKRVTPAEFTDALRLLKRLSPRQQAAAVAAVAERKAPKKVETKDSKPLAERKAKAKRRRGTNTKPREVVPVDALTVKSDGTVELWRNYKDRHASYKGGFKAQVDKKYRYKVLDDNGKEIVYNSQMNVYRFEGETIKGVPSIINPRRLSNDELFRTLSDYTTKVVNADNRGIKPGAPFWSVRDHGKIKALDDVGKGRAYGQMQIHHVDQWARGNFRAVNLRYERGEISKDELMRIYREDLLFKTKDKIGKGEKELWRIRMAEQGDRELVVLPERAHIGAAYDNNHPKGYNPETGKLEKLGIPVSKAANPNGRDWFNGFRDRFWTEIYRKETYGLQQEINRRIRSGKLSSEEVQRLWSEAHKKRSDYIEKANRDLERAKGELS